MLNDLYGAVKKWGRVVQEKQNQGLERKAGGGMSKRAEMVNLEDQDCMSNKDDEILMQTVL